MKLARLGGMVLGVVLGGIAGILLTTNPNRQDYEQGDLNLASSQFQKVSKLTPNLPKINWLSLSPKNWVESLALLGRLYRMYDIKNRGPGKQPLEKPSHQP